MTIANRTSDGRDACEDPSRVPDPGHPTVPRGRPALGLDLDGLPGIDNQFYHVVGCVRGYQASDPQDNLRAALVHGEHTILMEIRGVNDARNDPDVEVAFYSSPDKPTADATGNIASGASYAITADERHRTVTRGHIVDGVLITEAADLRLGLDLYYVHTEYFIRGAVFRLELHSDHSASGIMGGYEDIETLYSMVSQGGGLGTTEGLTCPGYWHALHRWADGFPDASGHASAISTARSVTAVPAFVIHPKPNAPRNEIIDAR